MSELTLQEQLDAIEPETPTTDVPIGELHDLCAVDPELYARTFFPKAFRQASPQFHADYWQKIEDPSFDFFGAEVFRGGAKTTLARVAISRRLAYAISRNVLNVCISESMALLTSRWLKKQVEFNSLWAQAYGLAKGDKWTDDHFEVHHKVEGCGIGVLAKGMTSGLRGLNLDDYRPDFIYCDDICNEENTATDEGLEKLRNLFFGALVPSLAPKSEAPMRKLVLTQTAIKKGDIISEAHLDPTFVTVKYPKLLKDPETGEEFSAWPERWSLAEVLAEKNAYIRRRQLYIWLREYGCKITGSAECAFNITWLRDWKVLPVGMTVYIAIDPSGVRNKKKSHKSAIVVIGIYAGEIYLLDYFAQKGQNPEQVWVVLSGFVRKWRPRQVGVETVGYQQTLEWYLRQKMIEENFFFPIIPIEDQRSKDARIEQAYAGVASMQRFFVRDDQLEFRAEFEEWTRGMDIDLLDAGAMAICMANPWMLVGGETLDEKGRVIDQIKEDEKRIPDLDYELGAP